MCHNVCLVTIGSNQRDDIDFTETFTSVVKPAMICIILMIVVTKKWKLQQLDVSNAFLHDILEEEVYMRQPSGFRSTTHRDYVCKL